MNIQLGLTIMFLIGLLTFLPTTIIHGQISAPPSISIQEELQQIVVYFQGDLAQIMATNDSYLQKLIDANEVMFSDTFDIDKDHKGLILYIIGPVKRAYEISKTLSLLDNIFMIEVDKPYPTSRDY